MCYPKPGPRCSAHSRARLNRMLRAHQGNPTHPAVLAAQDEFDASPAGRRLLREAVAAAESNSRAGVEAAGRLAAAERRWWRTHDDYLHHLRSEGKDPIFERHWPVCDPQVAVDRGAAPDAGAVDRVRREVLPTNAEAAATLHQAVATWREMEARTAAAREQADAEGRTYQSAIEDDIERARVWQERHAAMQAMLGTPEGQRYLIRRADGLRQQMGWYSGAEGRFRDSHAEMVADAAERRAEFAALTGQAPPEDTTEATAPSWALCRCDQYTFEGQCHHIDENERRQRMLASAVAGMPEAQGFARAVGAGRGSRLGRLFGR